MRFTFCLAILLATEVAAAQEIVRRHEKISLAVSEFQGERGSAPLRFRAYTQTALAFEIRYQYQSNGETVSAWLESAEVYAVFVPAESWWDDSRDNHELLDHEQGHFDITEIVALEFQLEIAAQLARGKALLVTAKNTQYATAALRAKFAAMRMEYEHRIDRQQARYDRVTGFSKKLNEQAAERLTHLETLRRLSSELAKLHK